MTDTHDPAPVWTVTLEITCPGCGIREPVITESFSDGSPLGKITSILAVCKNCMKKLYVEFDPVQIRMQKFQGNRSTH